MISRHWETPTTTLQAGTGKALTKYVLFLLSVKVHCLYGQVWWPMQTVPAFERWRQEDQKIKIIHSEPVWATWDSVQNKNREEKKEKNQQQHN